MQLSLSASFLSVTVSFDPTTYTVAEGEGVVANLKLVRSGDLSRTVIVNVTAATGTAMGMNTIYCSKSFHFLKWYTHGRDCALL